MNDLYNWFLKFTGLINISETNQIILLIALTIGCTILGFVTDNMMRSNGFGPVGNCLLLMIGFGASAILFNQYAGMYKLYTPTNFVLAIAIGPLLFLTFLAFCKRLVGSI